MATFDARPIPRGCCTHRGNLKMKFDGGRSAVLCEDCRTVLGYAPRTQPAPQPPAVVLPTVEEVATAFREHVALGETTRALLPGELPMGVAIDAAEEYSPHPPRRRVRPMTDWTTARVVRDRDGRLWGRDPWTTGAHLRRWVQVGAEREVDGCYEGDMERRYGPLTPVLDADGLPVVRTVGDLTARHIGRRVRVDGFEGKLEALLVYGYDGALVLELLADDDRSNNLRRTLDTPCEVLP